MITFCETGCVDCGCRFAHPATDVAWYSGIFQRYDNGYMTIYRDNTSNHFIILVRPTPGNDEPDKVFMSCQSFHDLIAYYGQADIRLFLDGKIAEIKAYQEAVQ